MNIYKQSLRTDQAGFTLVEIIVATAILSFAIVGASATFITLSRLHQSSLTVQKIQQESRAIVENITRDARSGASLNKFGNRLVITSSVTQDRVEYYLDTTTKRINRRYCENQGGTLSCAAPVVMNDQNLEVAEFVFEIDRNGSSGAPFVAFHFAFEYNGALSGVDPLFQRYELNAIATVRTING